MFEETSRVATAIAFGVLQLRTNLGATLAEPDEVHRGKLPVDAGPRRRGCGIVRLRRGHMTGRTADRFGPDAALSAMDIHAVHPGLGFARRRPDRNGPGVDMAIGTTRMGHHGFNLLPGLQPLGPADAARRQCILRLVFGNDEPREGCK
jgi:hypothetical protein